MLMTDAANGTAGVVTNLSNWAAQPFSTQMSLTGWAWFTGLVIVLCLFWFLVLHELKGDI